MKKKPFDWKTVAIIVLGVIAVAELALLWHVVFPQEKKTIDVLFIGEPSQSMLDLLSSEDYQLSGVTLHGALLDAEVTPESFKGLDVIVMQGEEYCDNALSAFVAANASRRFLIVGNACSRSQNYGATGWNALVIQRLSELHQGYRVADKDARPLALGEGSLGSRTVSGRLLITSAYDPLFNGILNFGFEGNAFVFKTYPSFKLAVLTDDMISQQELYEGNYSSIPAIVRMDAGGANAVYFAFDPSTTSRNMLLNALLDLRSQ
jgi:hypothetical protein